MKGYIICPVRNITKEDKEKVENFVQSLEARGWEIHYPPRNTNQHDETGLMICTENRKAIENSDRVFLYWDGKSTGCLFDMGMAFAFNKPLTILYIPPDDGSGKSFLKMPRAWELREIGSF